MRKINRLPLSATTSKKLGEWTKKIKRCRKPETRRARAEKMWKEKRRLVGFREVHEVLVVMNGGLFHCMYCECDRGAVRKKGQLRATVEHWYPKRRDPLKTFDWDNLFLACGICNTFLKGDDFPEDAAGQPMLLNPVVDDPLAELVFSPSTGAYVAQAGSKGEETLSFFELDQLDKQRRGVLEAYKAFILQYDQAVVRGDLAAGELKGLILAQPFRGVLVRMVEMARDPALHFLIGAPVATAINSHTMWLWL